MSLQQIPGQVGYVVKPFASAHLNKEQLGKFMDSNHLDMVLNEQDAQEYDKKITTLFSEGYNMKNTFFENIVNSASTYHVDNPNIPFFWDIDLPTQLPKIIDIPTATLNNTKKGIDGQPFQFVSSDKVFVLNDVVALGSYEHGPQIEIVADPLPHNGYWLYTAILSTLDKTEFLTNTWFKIGVPLLKVDNSIGEFDQDLSSIAHTGGKLRLYDRLGSSFGVEHTVTAWADQVVPKSKDGKPLDIQIITKYEIGAKGEKIGIGSSWMRTAEVALNKEMIAMKTRRFLYGSAATTQTSGQQQEVKYKSDGLIKKIRKAGNYMELPRGSFSINILRDIYDAFYEGRVDPENRETVLYTNRAGIQAFREASKQDLLNAGFTLILDDKFVEGKGQNLVLNWGVNGVVTEETGRIRMEYLPDLDHRGTEYEYGVTRRRSPVFLSLDVLNNGNNAIKNNIRIVRPKGKPGPSWGYINGRWSNRGFSATQGMNSASKFPGTTMWIDDRCDLRVDDLSRTLLIEEEQDFLY